MDVEMKVDASDNALKEDQISVNACDKPDKQDAPDGQQLTVQQQKDAYYWEGYASYHIHEEMIKDEVRTGTYREAIVENKHLFNDKVVLDVGCGTGILSMFACQAGAKKVYAVDFSNIVNITKKIVEKNKFEDRISVIHGKMEEVELPEKVDIIISEWMGYFLLYEAMLPSVLVARDKWLKPGGIMMPDIAELHICGIEDEQYRKEKVDWWKDVYGCDMSTIKEAALEEPLVDVCNSDQVITDAHTFKRFDLYTCTKEDLNFKTNFKVTTNRADSLTAMLAFFSVKFSKCHTHVGFYTGPKDQETHWKQTIFYLPKSHRVKRNGIIRGTILVNAGIQNPRDLDFKLWIKIDQATEKQVSMSCKYKMK